MDGETDTARHGNLFNVSKFLDYMQILGKFTNVVMEWTFIEINMRKDVKIRNLQITFWTEI